jgi:hypothetical protein
LKFNQFKGRGLPSILRSLVSNWQEVDEKDGKVSHNIQRYYGLSPSLCQQYAAIIYILDNRIDVAPRKWVTARTHYSNLDHRLSSLDFTSPDHLLKITRSSLKELLKNIT